MIRLDKPADIAKWVTPEIYQRVAEAIKVHGSWGRLKPIFLCLRRKCPTTTSASLWHT